MSSNKVFISHAVSANDLPSLVTSYTTIWHYGVVLACTSGKISGNLALLRCSRAVANQTTVDPKYALAVLGLVRLLQKPSLLCCYSALPFSQKLRQLPNGR